MPRFRYVGPIDAVDIPLLQRIVERGDEFEVPDAQAPLFAEQPTNFEPVTAKASAKANPAQEG